MLEGVYPTENHIQLCNTRPDDPRIQPYLQSMCTAQEQTVTRFTTMLYQFSPSVLPISDAHREQLIGQFQTIVQQQSYETVDEAFRIFAETYQARDTHAVINPYSII